MTGFDLPTSSGCPQASGRIWGRDLNIQMRWDDSGATFGAAVPLLDKDCEVVTMKKANVRLKMVADQWDSVVCGEEIFEDPSVEKVLEVVNRLDARSRTIVSLRIDSRVSLTIGGGNGQFVSYFVDEQGGFWNMLRFREHSGEMVMLNAGGQVGDFPSRQVVGNAEVIRAAMEFCSTGRKAEGLLWELQS